MMLKRICSLCLCFCMVFSVVYAKEDTEKKSFVPEEGALWCPCGSASFQPLYGPDAVHEYGISKAGQRELVFI